MGTDNTTGDAGNSNTTAEVRDSQTTDNQSEQTVAEQQGKEFTAPKSQADLDRIVEARLARERAKYTGFDDYKSKAEQFDELQEANKTELEKATARAEKAETELNETRSLQVRTEVASAKGLPAELAGRLAGNTREELEADADKIAALIAAPRSGGTVGAELGKPRDKNSGDWLRNALRSA
ncbi:MAG: DUF4355 domain-containing protein [Propionibacteriales bacterium]|nr:DUF4355 domain-containing protein [Propionibacteriales bacterium]